MKDRNQDVYRIDNPDGTASSFIGFAQTVSREIATLPEFTVFDTYHVSAVVLICSAIYKSGIIESGLSLIGIQPTNA